MAVKFYPHNHSYKSVDEFDNISWTSVTTLVSWFIEQFDAKEKAIKSSLNRKSKWYGIHPDKIQEIWKKENDRSVSLGNWYHKKQETDMLQRRVISFEGIRLDVFENPVNKDGVKIAPNQKLSLGVYPEHFVYSKNFGVCGQSDLVKVSEGVVDIDDYKSNKDLEKGPHVSWDGTVKKMLPPLFHLPDCSLSHYTLQQSTYMYIILLHNPNLKPGKISLKHPIFKKDSEDEFGYPVLSKDEFGNPIVETEKLIPLPYLKNEVEAMFEFKKRKKS